MTIKISAQKDGESNLQQNSHGLFLGIVFVLLLVGILGLTIWVSELSKSSAKVNETLDSRLQILEEQLQLADSTSTEFLSDVNSQLQFLDKEIRKLWDLSNKRNRKNITENLNSIEDLSVKIDDLIKINKTLSAKQRALSLELAKIAKIQEKTNQTMQDVNQVVSEATSEDLKDIQETLDSFNAYRLQVNKSLITMKEKINQLELVALDTSNE